MYRRRSNIRMIILQLAFSYMPSLAGNKDFKHMFA